MARGNGQPVLRALGELGERSIAEDIPRTLVMPSTVFW
jgi:hypothetical protein